MADVVAMLRDADRLREMAEVTFEEIALAPENSYQHFVRETDDAMAAAFHLEMRSPLPAYLPGEVEKIAVRNWGTLRRRAHRRANTLIYRALFKGLLGFMKPETRNYVHAHLRKFYRTITFRR